MLCIPFQFVHTSVLIVMDPPNGVEMTHRSHVFGKIIRFGEVEVIYYGNNVAIVSESCYNFLEKETEIRARYSKDRDRSG